MPMLEVHLLAGRSDEELRTMVSKLTDAMVESVGAERETVQVIVDEVQLSHWAQAGQTAEVILGGQS
ncbi:MAG: 2-hydroxymuconate tautomerase [Solirubrobacterales bacterium]